MTTFPPPEGTFDASTRHLVLLAHQDDELPYAGLLSRMPNVRVAFLTNGDGLHYESNMEPEPYAALRHDESVSALAEIGIGEDRIAFLDWSELIFYAEFGAMSGSATEQPLSPVFEQAFEDIDRVVREHDPDVVWTLAWQGGNPEHDLVNLCATRAVRALERRRGRPVPLYEFPAYELLVVAMRFPWWYPGRQFAIELTDAEVAAKARMLDMYPTQARVIGELRRAIELAGMLQRLRGRSYTFEDFGRREVFGAVPADRDYTRSTHRVPLLDYPFDDWKGQRIRFERTLARLGREWTGHLR